jgi:hypothetical protein
MNEAGTPAPPPGAGSAFPSAFSVLAPPLCRLYRDSTKWAGPVGGDTEVLSGGGMALHKWGAMAADVWRARSWRERFW